MIEGVYADETCKVFCGDVLEVVPNLPPHDLIVTDPPYGIGAAYDGERELTGDEYWEWLERVIAALRANAPVVVMTHRVKALAKLRQTWDWVCPWTKPVGVGVRAGNSPLIPTWEPIFVWGLHSIGSQTKGRPDVFRYAIEPTGLHGLKRGREGWSEDATNGVHPTPKPIGLMRDIVQTLGQGAVHLPPTLLDPFAGSGTTVRAGKDLGMNVTAVDRSRRYCDGIVERLAQEVLF